jgi:hypothetical protein
MKFRVEHGDVGWLDGDFTKKNVVIFSQETWGYDKQILRISPGYLAA